jgi:hypothetical protein
MGTLALIEVLARDGSVRQSQKVDAWPLRVGRALDNDLVLDDPHTAAHHFSVDANEDGVFVSVGRSVNGLRADGHRLAEGGRWQAGQHHPLQLVAGRTHLRLRLGEHPLPAELPMSDTQTLIHGFGSLLVLMALATAVFAFDTYLDADPDGIPRALATRFIGLLGSLLAWCGLWTLMSKIFSHQAHFWWHVRVLLVAVLAWVILDAVGSVLAFAFSWPWASDFDFLPKLTVMACALYFHLQAVEPHRRLLTRALSIAALAVGIGLTLWSNWQSSSRFGAELYMHHLFPPSMRLAAPVDTDTFMKRAQTLQKTLDENAGKEPDDAEEEAAEKDKSEP